MKKLQFAIIIFMLSSISMFSQQWTYKGKANTNNFAATFGVQYLVVDPVGKIWVSPYLTPNDSVWVPDSAKMKKVSPIYVFNEDGTPNDTIKYVQVGAKFMPFYGAGYGLALDNNGDIIVSKNGNIYRINHITHQGMNILERPYGGNTIGSPAVSSNGDVYICQAAPNAPLKILNYDFSFKANAIDILNDYGRLLIVSGDGNTIYVPRYSSNYTVRLKRPNSSGPYIADTVLIGAAIESGVWDNIDSTNLWFSVGSYMNQASGEFTGSDNTWIKFDTSNWARKDSIKWIFTNINSSEERPRGIAFNKTGDAYVAVFGSTIDTVIEKFHNPQHMTSINQFTWQSSITVKDNGNSQQVLTFGLSPIATDGIDEIMGEYPITTLPPTGTFDARFILPNGTEATLKDYRNGSIAFNGQKVHEIQYQAGTGNSITLNWNFPRTVKGRLQDEVTGSIIDVPMSDSGSYAINNPGVYNKLKFTVNYSLSLPRVPVLVSPAHRATDQPTEITLAWDSVSEASSYGIQVATDYEFTNLIRNDSNITINSIDLRGLLNYTTYFWRVNAKNNMGTSRYSTPFYFITKAGIPTAPLLFSPANNAVNQPTNLTFIWGSVINATSYRLQVATDPGFTNLLVNDSTLVTNSKTVSGLLNNTLYNWRVNAKNSFGTSQYSAVFSFSSLVTGISDEQNNIPTEYAFYQNYPNPFNPSTVIKYDLPKEGFVTIKICNILGKEVKTLVNDFKKAGSYKVTFDAGNLPSGIYFCRIKSNDFSAVRKLLLVK